MNNNAGTPRFLMLTLAFTAAFMHVFGVALLQWQMSHSSLYTYTQVLSLTSLSGTDGISTASYVVACLAIGAFAAWVFGIALSYCEYVHRQIVQMNQRAKYGHRPSGVKPNAMCEKGDDA